MASLRLISLKSASTIRNLSNYKSSLSLSNLYPQSSLNIASPVKIREENSSSFSGFIPIEKLDITYSRSSGPGGQHVNKVDTKVDIRFHVDSADWLADDIKKNILDKYKNRINKDGYLIVRSDRTRSQMYNQADAMTLLRNLIWSSITPEKTISEETIQLLRKRKERANQLRLLQKRIHSAKKQERNSDF